MLRRDHLEPHPIRQFLQWYEHALESLAEGGTHPDAMVLATATPDGRPSARTVLLVDVEEDGFVYLTSHTGRKSQEIARNPRVALVWLWERDRRQVRVEGTATPLPQEEADARWQRHPPARRLAEAAAVQGRPLAARENLVARWRELYARHPEGDVPRPPEWGGHRVVPARFEFWQQSAEDGLHDRFEYARAPDGAWRLQRLEP